MTARATDSSPALTTTVRVAVVLAAAYVGVQLFVTRPTAFPAGAGFTLRAGPIAGPLADPQSLRLTRPPDLSRLLDAEVAEVAAGGPADLAGVRVGDRVLHVADDRGARLDLSAPGSGAAALAGWRTAWWLDVRRPFTLTVLRSGRAIPVTVTPRWFPDVADGLTGPWQRRDLSGSVHIVA